MSVKLFFILEENWLSNVQNSCSDHVVHSCFWELIFPFRKFWFMHDMLGHASFDIQSIFGFFRLLFPFRESKSFIRFGPLVSYTAFWRFFGCFCLFFILFCLIFCLILVPFCSLFGPVFLPYIILISF